MARDTKKSTESAAPIDKAWFEAQIRRIGTSTGALSQQITESGHPSLLGRSLRGERELGVGELCALAKAFGVGVADIVQRLGHLPPRARVRVVGTINARGRIEGIAPSKQRTADAPPDLGPSAEAIEVRAQFGTFFLPTGAMLYYEASETPRPDAHDRLSVIRLGEHPAPIVGVLQRGLIGGVRVSLLDETIDSGDLISATPIRWMRFA